MIFTLQGWVHSKSNPKALNQAKVSLSQWINSQQEYIFHIFDDNLLRTLNSNWYYAENTKE